MPAVIRRSPSSSPPPAKRQRLSPGISSGSAPYATVAASLSESTEPSTIDDKLKSTLNYRDGVMLAPMVRSGTLPSRLLALRYGADLVWGPEIVDRAMIGCSRVVDEETGVITYEKSGKPIWTTHPVEKPYLIYQIGSSSPELAAQSALVVAQDVSGVELNCGCPKPFSTHAGMGANLLSTPDLLCDILRKLRTTLPESIAVSAKIRLLPSQEDTLSLVRKIVSTGVSCLTVHCRTKEMRKREPALVHRLREIVECVEEMGVGIPMIENGDCESRDDALRLRELTGAHSVMIATAAERNLSCFTAGQPLLNAETELAPVYFALARWLKNPWGNSKHCLSQFSSPRSGIAPSSDGTGSTATSSGVAPGTRASIKEFKQRLSQAKDYSALEGDVLVRGEDVMNDVRRVLARRHPAHVLVPEEAHLNVGERDEEPGTEPLSLAGGAPIHTPACESDQTAAPESPRTRVDSGPPASGGCLGSGAPLVTV